MQEKKLQFNGVKVFSATMAKDRDALGEKVTEWLRRKQADGPMTVTDYIVSQSSDEAFHCISITVFWAEGSLLEAMHPKVPTLPLAGPGVSKNGTKRLNFREP